MQVHELLQEVDARPLHAVDVVAELGVGHRCGLRQLGAEVVGGFQPEVAVLEGHVHPNPQPA